MSHETPIKQRLYVTFGKFGALKYTGNLDVAKLWERVLRRADLPLLYTEGFNTRARIQLASALPLGITSECEILDVTLREELATLDGLKERIESVSPDGLVVYKIEAVSPRSPALQPLVQSAEYRITLHDPVDNLHERVAKLLASEQILKVRVRRKNKRKSVTDLRPLIYDLTVDDNGDLLAHLATGERTGNLRPEDLLEELGLQDVHCSVHRYRLHIDEYGREYV